MAGVELPLHFGVELELVHTISREKASQLLNDKGIKCTAEEWEAPRPYDTWLITEDESIRPQGFEVVSPVLRGDAGLDEARRVAMIMLESGAEVNDSTGFHVHLDASAMSTGLSMSLEELKSVAAAFTTSEEVFDSIMPEARRKDNNTFCMSNVFDQPPTSCVPRINRCRSVAELRNLVSPIRYRKLNYTNLTDEPPLAAGGEVALPGPKVRFAIRIDAAGKVNHEKRTVEFRLHEGTCNPVDVVNWVKLLQLFVGVAKGTSCLTFEDKPMDSFEKFFSALMANAQPRAVKELRSHYQRRKDSFDPDFPSAKSSQWSQYLAWIQSFERVSCRKKDGTWNKYSRILEVSTSEDWKHAPIKVRLPGSDGPVNAWVGLGRLGLRDSHRLRPNTAKWEANNSHGLDLSCLRPGMQLHALDYDDRWHPAEVIQISSSKARSDAPVKICYCGRPKEAAVWLSVVSLRSKALKHLKKQIDGLGKLTPGLNLQALGQDEVWYTAEVVSVCASKRNPVKVHFMGYFEDSDEWLPIDRLRSKVLKV